MSQFKQKLPPSCPGSRSLLIFGGFVYSFLGTGGKKLADAPLWDNAWLISFSSSKFSHTWKLAICLWFCTHTETHLGSNLEFSQSNSITFHVDKPPNEDRGSCITIHQGGSVILTGVHMPRKLSLQGKNCDIISHLKVKCHIYRRPLWIKAEYA